MGVWIETLGGKVTAPTDTSHPSWVCGLKLALHHKSEWKQPSHPSWVCGLKQNIFDTKYKQLVVTPFVGVWIETLHSFNNR